MRHGNSMEALLWIALIVQPAKADTGDTVAWAVSFVLFAILLCAGIGAYARRYDSSYK